MFTKNFYRRLWLHWLVPTQGQIIFPQEMYGKTAEPRGYFMRTQYVPSGSLFATGQTYDGFSCGTEVATVTSSDATAHGQYLPNNSIRLSTNYPEKSLILSEDSYDENTFYDTVIAKAPINFNYTVRRNQSDTTVVYDSTTDSIKKTYSYTVTNSTGSTKTVRSISGTIAARGCDADGSNGVNTYLLIWAINLDTPVEINNNESATLTITYRWDNCTPGSQANPYSISASVSQ